MLTPFLIATFALCSRHFSHNGTESTDGSDKQDLCKRVPQQLECRPELRSGGMKKAAGL
jgi:hypothetical protein